MMLRSSARHTSSSANAVRAAQLEELRHEEARRALERDSRSLWRQFGALERSQRSLRADHDFQRERVNLMTAQFNAVMALVVGDSGSGAPRPLSRANSSCVSAGGVAEAAVSSLDGEEEEEADRADVDEDPYADLLHAARLTEALQTEKECLERERARLLRRNAELELQVSTAMAQFGRLVTDYERVRVAHDQLKAAVASASSVGDLAEWVSL